MTATEKLTRALVEMASRGERPRCGDFATRDYWTSDDKHERELAADWCSGCKVLLECREAGADEPAGVWGGVDVVASKAKPHQDDEAAA